MRRLPTAAPFLRPPPARPLGRAMAHPSGVPLRPHRPPRACGGFQQRHPGTPPAQPPRQGYGTPPPAHPRPHRRPPRACGGSQQRHPLAHPSAGLWHTPPAHPSAHIAQGMGWFPTAALLRHTPSDGSQQRHPSGAPLWHAPSAWL